MLLPVSQPGPLWTMKDSSSPRFRILPALAPMIGFQNIMPTADPKGRGPTAGGGFSKKAGRRSLGFPNKSLRRDFDLIEPEALFDPTPRKSPPLEFLLISPLSHPALARASDNRELSRRPESIREVTSCMPLSRSWPEMEPNDQGRQLSEIPNGLSDLVPRQQ